MRLEQREWEMDKLREQGHGRDQSTQGPVRTGKASELSSPGEALEGVRVCPCMWVSGGRREGGVR